MFGSSPKAHFSNSGKVHFGKIVFRFSSFYLPSIKQIPFPLLGFLLSAGIVYIFIVKWYLSASIVSHVSVSLLPCPCPRLRSSILLHNITNDLYPLELNLSLETIIVGLVCWFPINFPFGTVQIHLLGLTGPSIALFWL